MQFSGYQSEVVNLNPRCHVGNVSSSGSPTSTSWTGMLVGMASSRAPASDMSSMLVSSTRMDSFPLGASRGESALQAKNPSRSPLPSCRA